MYVKMKNIYDALSDDQSKRLFVNKMAYSLTGDWGDLKQMLLSVAAFSPLSKGLNMFHVIANPEQWRNKKVIVFGAGLWGRVVHQLLGLLGIDIAFYSDNCMEKIDMDFEGKTIISPKDLVEKHLDAYIIVAADRYGQEITDQLLSKGVSINQIVRLCVTDKMVYFDDDIVKPRNQEIFIDGGCYDGYSSETFLQWAGISAKKIYGFEPDEENFIRCRQYFQTNVKIPYKLRKVGLFNEPGQMGFSETHDVGAHVEENGTSQIAVAPLDDIIDPKDQITFIKLDIEGTELKALHGAIRTIQRCQPVLAVCIYHKPEDIWEIPQFVHELLPKHRLYVRHYSPWIFDTVLYAIP